MLNNSKVQAVILAGGRDFGRCKLASKIPTCFWPFGEKSVLERLIYKLKSSGIKNITACLDCDGEKAYGGDYFDNVKFLNKKLPLGTAGSIRDSASDFNGTLFLVLKASILNVPDVDKLIEGHVNSLAAMTVVVEPKSDIECDNYHASDIYICNRKILKYIPKVGYCDIKETLIPTMVKAGEKIHVSRITHSTNSFHDSTTYLNAIGAYFNDRSVFDEDVESDIHQSIDPSAKVSLDLKIFGPVIIMKDAVISKGVVIFGPAMIGKGSFVGEGSFIENSILWANSKIGTNCEIINCVTDYDTKISDNVKVVNQSILASTRPTAKPIINETFELVEQISSKFSNAMGLFKRQLYRYHKRALYMLSFSLLLMILLWSYWPTVLDMWNIWQISDEYSSGLLVPFLAVYVLWVKRDKLAGCQIRPCWYGFIIMLLVQTLRYFGLYFMYASIERFAFILTIWSLVLFVFGWQIFKKNFTILLFLCLMMPLPRSIHNMVMLPLQSLATASAVFFLETMGYVVSSQGNIIHLNNVTISIAEVCNGLRMVTAFFVIIGMSVLLMQRPLWERIVVFVSSLPIALFCNSIRLTVTSIFFATFSTEKWGGIFHDFGGYAMMPLAIIVVVFELWILAKLTYIPQNDSHRIVFKANPT